MDASGLSIEELIAITSRVADQNQLMIWWETCYGSPGGIEKWGEEYHWQKDFYDAGAYASQRLLMAANGVGKSQTVCAELAAHVTGRYPKWWKGYRFERGGFEVWIGAIDNDMQKRGPQRALLGRNLEDEMGTGLIPADTIVKSELRQAGVKSVIDTLIVRHVSGENVTIKWLTFEQGWRKWQSGDPKIILWDEEPDETNVDQKDILDEALTRLVRNSGIFLCGYTPLLGETQLTQHFMDSEDPKVAYFTASWDDAPHMDQEAKDLIANQYSDSQRETRTKGIPMMGEGRIFTTPENLFLIDPIPIPDHWALISGIDFGGVANHPQALATIAWDRDQDIKYLIDCWRSNCKIRDHAHVINARGKWIPVAWPHDGMNHDPKSGERLHDIYRNEYECNLLNKSARYKNESGGGQAQWPIIEDVRMWLDTGQFKVFRTCQPFIQEYRSYHTKDGKIVAKRDDVLKATFYALMMRRYGRSRMQANRRARPRSEPMPFSTAVR